MYFTHLSSQRNLFLLIKSISTAHHQLRTKLYKIVYKIVKLAVYELCVVIQLCSIEAETDDGTTLLQIYNAIFCHR